MGIGENKIFGLFLNPRMNLSSYQVLHMAKLSQNLELSNCRCKLFFPTSESLVNICNGININLRSNGIFEITPESLFLHLFSLSLLWSFPAHRVVVETAVPFNHRACICEVFVTRVFLRKFLDICIYAYM